MDPNNPEKVIFQPQPTPSKEEILNKKSPPNYLLWALIGGVVVMFLIVIMLVVIGINLVMGTVKNMNTKTQVETPIIEQPTTTIPFKSKFASDAGVLKIKDDLVKLQSDINSTDILEPQITPPNLDLNISIQSSN